MNAYGWLIQYAQFFAAFASVISAFIPIGTRSETSRIDRCIIALAAGTVSLLLWPTTLAEFCSRQNMFGVAALLFLLAAVLSYLAHLLLRDRFGYRQSVDDKSFIVLGSSVLTPEAQELQRSHPNWPIQKIFKELRFERAATWEGMSRSRIVIVDAAVYIVLGASMILTVASLAACLYSKHEVRSLHRSLAIEPAADQTLAPGASRLFRFAAQGCKFTWSIQSPSNVRDPGDITSGGLYTAPEQVDHPFEVYVTAAWPFEGEPKVVTIHVVPLSEDVAQTVIAGQGPNGEPIKFAVKVIDGKHSWIYNDYSLSGNIEGAALVRRLADSGQFNGYEEIICIGAASREFVTTQKEDDRALERAAILSKWVLDATRRLHTPIYALKVGRYAAEKGTLAPPETAGERLVVIIGASHPGTKVDVLYALRDAFQRNRSREPILGLYLDHYPSQWVLAPAAEVASDQ